MQIVGNCANIDIYQFNISAPSSQRHYPRDRWRFFVYRKTMIQTIRTQANTIRSTMKPADIAATVLLWPFWALGWLAGFVWYVVTLMVAAVMVGFKAGRGI